MKLKGDQLRKIQDSFEKVAQKQNVRIKFLTKASFSELSRTIVEISNTNDFSFIAMASQSGPLATTILGSVARDVIRTASRPVLSIRLRDESKVQEVDTRPKVCADFRAVLT